MKSSASKILKQIDEFKVSKNITFMEAVIEFCEKNKIELEAVGDAIRQLPRYKSMMEEDASNLNMLKTKNKTPKLVLE